jgi:hypothetical protein
LSSSGGNNWVAGVQIGIDILPLSKHAELAREAAAMQHVDVQVAAYLQPIPLELSQAYIHR